MNLFDYDPMSIDITANDALLTVRYLLLHGKHYLFDFLPVHSADSKVKRHASRVPLIMLRRYYAV
jgi:hypothetical protein